MAWAVELVSDSSLGTVGVSGGGSNPDRVADRVVGLRGIAGVLVFMAGTDQIRATIRHINNYQ